MYECEEKEREVGWGCERCVNYEYVRVKKRDARNELASERASEVVSE